MLAPLALFVLLVGGIQTGLVISEEKVPAQPPQVTQSLVVSGIDDTTFGANL